MVLLLNRSDLLELLPPAEVLAVAQRAFETYTLGATQTPQRIGLEPRNQDGVILVMPCAVDEPPIVGTKIVSVYPRNPVRSLPRLTSLYLLSDAATGAPRAVMDGTHLTAVRTAAGSACATSVLARPDTAVLGVFGTGVQALAHVHALLLVRPLARVVVAGTSPEAERSFAERVTRETGLPAEGAPASVVSAADILAVCTTSPSPVVLDACVRPGAHVNAVGAFTPLTRELPAALVARSRFVADTRAGVLAEAGDVLLAAAELGRADPASMLHAELGEVLLGLAPGRKDPGEITVYKSVGAAFLDAMVADLAYRRARERGLGTEFAFA